MSVRKFLLPVSSTASAEAALHCGLMLAKMWNAHLQVIHVTSDSLDMTPLVGEGLSGALIEEMMSTAERESGSRARSLRDMFYLATEAAMVAVGQANIGANEPSAGFSTVMGREEEVVAFQARLADMTIVPHPLAGEDVAAAEALHAALFDSGRAVLMAPVDIPQSIGKRVVIAWSGTSNAASALAAVMPFVRQAEAVAVLTSPDYFRNGPPAEEVVDYIANHGVEARIVRFRAINRVTGAGLLAAAADFGADLMAMGAYSTSRWRELILGGTTRYTLENAMLPVLMTR